MLETTLKGPRIHWQASGDPTRPTVVLLNSIGTGLRLWSACATALKTDLQVIQMDTRGHGASEAPEGDYDMGSLADDVVRVMDQAGVERAAIAGVSLGGMMAMELALSHPARVAGLALICTSAEMDREAWSHRVETVRARGMAAIADLAITRFLSPEFASSRPKIAESIRRGLIETAPSGYAGAGAAIRDMNLIDRIAGIRTPTAVVAGDRDVSTPFAGHGSRIAAAIPNASTVHIDCAHLAQVERPDAVTAIVRAVALNGDGGHNAGLAVREPRNALHLWR